MIAIPAVSGCTDASACNYDYCKIQTMEVVNIEEGYDCDGNAVCNYSSVDFVGNESINEYEGVLYFNLEVILKQEYLQMVILQILYLMEIVFH